MPYLSSGKKPPQAFGLANSAPILYEYVDSCDDDRRIASFSEYVPPFMIDVHEPADIAGAALLRPCPAADEFEFVGRHLLASYMGCDAAALADETGLLAAMKAAVKASGATLISSLQHSFTPSGMTAVMLLSESHASIHTYPEHQACFVDLFTCGRGCSAERFEAVICKYLKPTRANHRTIVRHGAGEGRFLDDRLNEWAA